MSETKVRAEQGFEIAIIQVREGGAPKRRPRMINVIDRLSLQYTPSFSKKLSAYFLDIFLLSFNVVIHEYDASGFSVGNSPPVILFRSESIPNSSPL